MGRSLRQAALGTGMDEKTARKYERAVVLPSQSRKAHRWRTRGGSGQPLKSKLTS